MPGDVPFVKSNNNKQNMYDVIVVGSGISGGWAAKELCEKGLKVLMLERGDNIVHPNYPTATKDPWEFPHHLHLSEEDKKQQFVQSRHWSFKEDNKHFYINDQENKYEETKRFDWIRGNIVGGRSVLWSRAERNPRQQELCAGGHSSDVGPNVEGVRRDYQQHDRVQDFLRVGVTNYGGKPFAGDRPNPHAGFLHCDH